VADGLPNAGDQVEDPLDLGGGERDQARVVRRIPFGLLEGSLMTDPRRAFDRSFAAICEATDFEAAEDHLGHALTDVYRLYERAKQPPSSPASRRAALEASPEGCTALAIAWARTFHTHDVVEVSKAADIYSRHYTRIYGVLAWRPRSDFTANADGEDRHLFYDTYLEGHPVLDTLRTAVSALEAVIPPT
jgi:hypothetical protein